MGLTLEDVVSTDGHDHLAFASKDWNGESLLAAVDGIVTYYGTIGIEGPAVGTPVMVAEKGWYSDCGFVTVPGSREEYCSLLNTKWWTDGRTDEKKQLALLFAGWYWGRPSWQENCILKDDANQWELYGYNMKLIKKNKVILEHEVKMIREWFDSGHPHYHTYKMLMADEYLS